jgi:hypothetical protein
LRFSINTAVSGEADRSVKLAAIRECINLAQIQEQTAPGTWDQRGLLGYFFMTAGIREVNKFMLKSPFTEGEVEALRAIDSIARLQSQSALPNMEDPNGMPVQPSPLGQDMGSMGSLDGQSMNATNLDEASGVSGF